MKPTTTLLIFLLLGLAGSIMAQAPPSVSGETLICAGATTTLTATGESGATFAWYDLATGGVALSTSATYTTPALSADEEYYVEQTTGSGTSARTQVSIFVSPIPSPNQPTNVLASPSELCQGGSSSLSASVDKTNNQVVYWYDAPTGGNLLSITDSGDAFVVTPTDTTIYYAQSDVETFTQTFNYTGGVQTFVVPAGVFSIDVDAYGGRGGWGNYKAGGNGGRVETTLNVTPGQTLNIYVGGQGQSYGSPYSGIRTGGWNGGASSYSYKAGAGGGATDIRIGGTALTDRVVVAGAGGGSGGSNCSSGSYTGAKGGGLVGGAGGACNGNSSSRIGQGGTQTAGGARGCRFTNSYCGSNGTLGAGGRGTPSDGGHYGGAGGGGYYGGGGGSSNTDGGGGSSYTDPVLCSNVIHTQGVQNGHGQLVINYVLSASCASTTRTPVTVNVNTVPTVTVSSDTAICTGNSVTLTASGADTYVWMPGNLTGSSITVTPSATTTYTVTGTLTAGGCSSEAQVAVTISQVIVSGDVTICEGISTTLTASGSNTYSWEPDALSGASVTVSPTTTTEYIVTGTEVNGCTTKDTVIVSVNPAPVLTVSADTAVEYGASVNLSVSGADTYSWSPGGATTATTTVAPTAHTTYTVTGTYTATACNSSEVVTISVIDPITVGGDKRICEGETTTLTASGATGASFAWYDAATGGTLLGSTAAYTSPVLNTTTDYYVEQSFGAYTSDRVHVSVIVNNTPTPATPTNVLASPSEACFEDSVYLSASVDMSSLQRVFWYDSLVGGSLLGITDSGESLAVLPIDTTTYYAQSAVEAVTQTFNYTGAVQTFVVPAGVTSIEVDAYGGRGGWGNYKAGGNGGRVQTTMDVTPGQTLNIYVGGQGQSYGSPYSGIRTGGWNGGASSYSYKAGAGGGATDIRIGGTALADRVVVAGAGGGSGGSNCSSGSYTGAKGGGLVGGTGGACNGNSSSRIGRGGTQTAGGARGCRFGSSYCGSNGTLGAGGRGTPSDGGHYGGAGGGGYYGGGGGSSNTDGGGGSSYTDPGLCTNVIHTQGVQNGNGVLIINYTLAESCGLDTRVPVTVNVNLVPTVTVSSDTAICNGNTVTLTANGADTYVWMPGNLSGSSITVTPDSTTTYTVTGSLSAGGCSNEAQVTVTISQVVASADIAICEGETTTLTASGSNTYTWEPGSLSGASIDVTPLTTTTYTVTGTGVNGCTTTDVVTVTVNPIPALTISADTAVNYGASVDLSASGADTYSWSPGGATTATATVSPSAHTTYTVTGTYTATGCYASESVVVSIIDPIIIGGDKRICEGTTTTLTASGSVGASFAWYDAATGGTLLASTAAYTSPVLNTTTDYYVEQSMGAYVSPREKVTVLVNNIPSPASPTNVMATPSPACEGDSVSLSASVDKAAYQRVFWYDSLVGGNLLAIVDSGELFKVLPLDTTTYYAESAVEEVTQTFNYTGAVQTFVVPAGVTSIQVDAYGGRGGWGNYKAGGNGGRVETTLNVIPGQTLNLYVGGQGQSYGSPYSGIRTGGWNGGASSYSYKAGAGGGATDIRIGGTALTDRVVVAGAGGGSGGSNCSSGNYTGAKGGGLVGGTGGACNGYGSSRIGRGGTQTAGGARGCRFGSSYCGSNGTLGAGGRGTPSDGGHYGGAGGGGYYGGGGGSSNADGGGGSSYTDPTLCTNVTHTQGVQNGNGQLVITYTQSESCASGTRVPVTVNVNAIPAVVTASSVLSCPGGAATLTATGADSYTWIPGNLTGNSVTVNPLTTTTYTVVGSDVSGACTDTAYVDVIIQQATVSSDTNNICGGISATLTATGADSYTWMPGNLTGNSVTVNPTTTTTYVVTATHASGCDSQDSVEIVVIPAFTLATTPDTTVLNNTKVTLTASGADSIVWSPGDVNAHSIDFLATVPVTYTATGYNLSTGCQATATVDITIDDMPDVSGTTIILKGASTTLLAEVPSRMTTYAWYDAPVGGNLLGSNASYTTPPLDTNTVYFVEMDDGSGVSLRKCIKVNVIDAESTTAESEQDSLCPSGNTNLIGELENPGTIEWYNAPTGGSLVGTSDRGANFPITPSATTTYYAQGATEQQVDVFSYTGAVQSFTVPEGVTSICIDASGASGGDAIATNGGLGGRVKASINVTPGDVLYLYVGGEGLGYVNGDNTTRFGGWNGGGNALVPSASGGGGASDVRIGGTSLLDRILVAGGGGGAKSDACATTPAGDGGDLTGSDGGMCVGGTAGIGGTQSAGGTGGCNASFCGVAGTFGQGGASSSSSATVGGGGGGGGWYGGGGGHGYGNGGGGSSYTHLDRCANVIHTQGFQNGNGRITLTYSLNNSAVTRAAVTIDVGDYENPQPDVANLPTEQDESSVTLTAPTASDNCAGPLTATTTDPTSYNTPGTYTVNWEYDDGNGNFVQQVQTVVISGVLPVELMDFVGRKSQNKVILNWTTASELNSKGFGIERSSDAANWEEIDFVASIGNSSSIQRYEFIDEKPMKGTNYYRLLLLDNDNSFDYSNIVVMQFDLIEGGIELFPNPSGTGRFTVTVTDDAFNFENANLVVFDQLGRKVLEQVVENTRVELNIGSLPAGNYTVRVSSGLLYWQARAIVIKE